MNDMSELFKHLLKYDEFVSFIHNVSDNYKIYKSRINYTITLYSDSLNNITSFKIDKDIYYMIIGREIDITFDVKVYKRNLQISKI